MSTVTTVMSLLCLGWSGQDANSSQTVALRRDPRRCTVVNTTWIVQKHPGQYLNYMALLVLLFIPHSFAQSILAWVFMSLLRCKVHTNSSQSVYEAEGHTTHNACRQANM